MRVTDDSEKTSIPVQETVSDGFYKGMLSVFGLYLSIALLGGFVYGIVRLLRYFAHVR